MLAMILKNFIRPGYQNIKMFKNNFSSYKLSSFKILTYLYSKSRGILACLICLLLIVFFNSKYPVPQAIKHEITTFMYQAFQAAIAPIKNLIDTPSKFRHSFISYHEYSKLTEENILLQNEIAHLKIEINELAKLKEILHFHQNQNYKFYLTTRIVKSNNGFDNISLINAGQNLGVEINDIVVNQSGLVGKVINTADTSSHIMLITDNNSRIPALILPERQKCFIAGYGTDTNLLKIKYLPQEFQLNDQQIVITSGEGSIFPYGIIIGEIRKVNNNYNLTSRGLAGDLEFVQLIKKQND